MEYVIKLTRDELLIPDVIDEIKTLLDKPFEISIVIKESPCKECLFEESREEYISRLNRSISDIENNRNLITFTAEQFKKFADALSKN